MNYIFNIRLRIAFTVLFCFTLFSCSDTETDIRAKHAKLDRSYEFLLKNGDKVKLVIEMKYDNKELPMRHVRPCMMAAIFVVILDQEVLNVKSAIVANKHQVISEVKSCIKRTRDSDIGELDFTIISLSKVGAPLHERKN